MANKEFEDVNAAFAAYAKEIAIVRGEAIAGRVLSIQVLDLLLFSAPDPVAYLQKLDENIQDTLNAMRFSGDDPASAELDALSREHARMRCLELIDAARTRHSGRKK
jgi:hypothetical protein